MFDCYYMKQGYDEKIFFEFFPVCANCLVQTMCLHLRSHPHQFLDYGGDLFEYGASVVVTRPCQEYRSIYNTIQNSKYSMFQLDFNGKMVKAF